MKGIVTTVLVLMLAAVSNAAWATSEQTETMRSATDVLNDFVNIPENAIPPALLSQAYGIAVIPGVIKAGFIVGGRYGEGVLSVRTADGTWSHPVFIDIAGASVGWQIGAQSSDIILVFKDKRGINHIVNGQVTLGADVSIAAGPVGRTASAATNLQLNAEIYSYSRSRGLFAGVALEGGVITIDSDANWRYYGDVVDSRTILQRSKRDTLPKSGQRFVYTLDQYMPPLNDFGNGVVDGDAVNQTGGQYGTGKAQAYGSGQAQPGNTVRTQQSYRYGQRQSSGNPAAGGGYSQSPDTSSRYGPVYGHSKPRNGAANNNANLSQGSVSGGKTGTGY